MLMLATTSSGYYCYPEVIGTSVGDLVDNLERSQLQLSRYDIISIYVFVNGVKTKNVKFEVTCKFPSTKAARIILIQDIKDAL